MVRAAFVARTKSLLPGYEYAARGLKISVSGWWRFHSTMDLRLRLLDELAVNAYWIERHQECLEACQRLLARAKCPADMHDRVKKNADFAAEKIRLQVRR